MFNNLNTPELVKFQVNISIVKTSIISHYFPSSLLPPPVHYQKDRFNTLPYYMTYKSAINAHQSV